MLLSRKLLSSFKRVVFAFGVILSVCGLYVLRNYTHIDQDSEYNSADQEIIESPDRERLAVIIPLDIRSITVFSTFLKRLKKYPACDPTVPNVRRPIDFIIFPNKNWKTLGNSMKNQIRLLVEEYIQSNRQCFSRTIYLPISDHQSQGVLSFSQQLYEIYDRNLLKQSYTGFLWLEPDLIPIRANWVDTIQTDFHASQTSFWIQGFNLTGGMTSDNVPHLSRAGLYNLLDQEFSRIIGKTIAYINPNKYPTGIGDALVKVIESPEYFHLRRNQSKLLQKFRFSEFIYILRDSGTFNRMLIRTILPNTYFLKSYDDQVFTSSYVDEDKVTDNEVSSGVSIFTAIRNRNDIIDITLPTWYNTKGVNEVVIVDWSSDPPLQPIIERHRLKSPIPILLFVIPNRHRWVLSPAFNIAARNTRYDKILKVDSDTLLDSDFVKAHSLPKGGFFAGNWRVSYKHGDLNIRHLNGIAFFHRHHFVNLLNGYDERINTYGWDDDNLYQRARNGGLIRYELNYHKIRHYEHNDNIRSSEECVECETSINRVATKKMPDWGPRFTNSRCLNWRVTEDITPQKFRPKLTTGLAVNLTSVCTDLISHPSSVRDYFTDSQWNRIVRTGYINVLKWRTQIPHTDLNSVRYPTTAKILSQIYSPKRLNHLGYFIIHVQHGLGNRIRSYISAKSIAERTGRKLIVIWEPDVHCFAEFYDIFGAETNETVLKEFNLNWFKEKNFRLFNYFEWEGGTKNELIDANISKDIYVKSSFKLVSVQSKQSAEDQILRSLPYSDMVSAIIKNWLNTHNLTRETIGTYVGVHIRMISNITEDVGNLSPLETKVMKEAVPYRQNCNYSSFITNLSSFPPTTKFFVAIDKTQHIEDLENKFPRRIKYIDRGNCAVDRSVECVQYAMSDLIVLGWTKKVIGSRWSSFSEIARRLNKAGHAITAC